jgi:hypothetical protein
MLKDEKRKKKLIAIAVHAHPEEKSRRAFTPTQKKLHDLLKCA